MNRATSIDLIRKVRAALQNSDDLHAALLRAGVNGTHLDTALEIAVDDIRDAEIHAARTTAEAEKRRK